MAFAALSPPLVSERFAKGEDASPNKASITVDVLLTMPLDNCTEQKQTMSKVARNSTKSAVDPNTYLLNTGCC